MKYLFALLLFPVLLFATTENDPTTFPTGYVPTLDHAPYHEIKVEEDLPKKFSWKDLGFDVPVRHQGNCGSCWAFASVQTLNYAVRIFTNKPLEYSEQQVVSCDDDFWGCSGGGFAMPYMIQAGMLLEEHLPYKAKNGICPSSIEADFRPTAWAKIGSKDRAPRVAELKTAVHKYGAIAATVAATMSWQTFKGPGVKKSCGGWSINHMVNIIGWDDEKGDEGAWLVKNSWGQKWGDKGYGWIPYGCDHIANSAAYIEIGK